MRRNLSIHNIQSSDDRYRRRKKLNVIKSSNENTRNKMLFKLFTILLCFTLFLWQMGLSLKRYWNYPVTTLIKISSSKAVDIPSVTICNNYYRLVDMFFLLTKERVRPDSVNLELPSDNLTQFWIDYGIAKNHVSTLIPCDYYKQYNSSVTECEDYHSHGELTNDLVIQTVLGQCIDVTLNYQAHQRIFGMAIRIKENKNFKSFYPNISFKEYYNVFPHEKNVLYINDVFINTRAPQAVELWLALEKTEYVRLNSPKDPCQNVQDHINCINKCVDKNIFAEISCRLPYMANDMPICDTWPDILKVFSMVHLMYSSGDIFKCTCTRACKAIEYKVNRIESMDKEDNDCVMSVELENRFDEIIEESYMYPFSSLVNDFSALVGFFLGFSLPDVVYVVRFVTKKGLNCSYKMSCK